MEVLYGTCSGVDVHKKLLVVCLRRGKKSEIRSFGTTTQELFDAVEWLKNNGCEMVAMESTGSYWKPLYNVLEAMEVPAMVVNAQHMKAVPGRKTDVNDAQWIAKLLQHGLLQPSFIPDKAQRCISIFSISIAAPFDTLFAKKYKYNAPSECALNPLHRDDLFVAHVRSSTPCPMYIKSPCWFLHPYTYFSPHIYISFM